MVKPQKDERPTRGGGGGGKGRDPELDKIATQRSAVLTTRKWQNIISAMSDQVSDTLIYSDGVPEAEEFLIVESCILFVFEFLPCVKPTSYLAD